MCPALASQIPYSSAAGPTSGATCSPSLSAAEPPPMPRAPAAASHTPDTMQSAPVPAVKPAAPAITSACGLVILPVNWFHAWPMLVGTEMQFHGCQPQL